MLAAPAPGKEGLRLSLIPSLGEGRLARWPSWDSGLPGQSFQRVWRACCCACLSLGSSSGPSP
eukprot:5591909-Alexandrium_andersonii.AAC.1